MSSSSLTTLLDYYRDLADSFEKERQEYIEKFQQVSVSRADHQQLEWRLDQKDDKIRQLQKALSDAHVYLYDEREHVLKLTAENDELRIRTNEDRKRIQQLLGLTRPLTEEVTYFRQTQPRTIQLPFQSKENQSANPKKSKQKKKKPPVPKASTTTPSQNILRTIYLPDEKAESTNALIDSLRAQVRELEKLGRDREIAYREDRKIRDHETSAALASAEGRRKELEQQVVEMSLKHRRSLKEYLVYRHHVGQEKRELMERLSTSEKEREMMKMRREETSEERVRQMALTEEREQEKAERLANELRKQTMDREEDLVMIKEQYAMAQGLYENKMKAMEEKLKKTKGELERVRRRRKLEQEGLTTELGQVRDQVRRLARLILQMRVVESGHVSSIVGKTPKAEKEIEELAERLEELEKQLE